MVDTGATGVALTEGDARRLGIALDPANYQVVGSGASGAVYGQFVTLDSVSLDGKRVEQVSGAVLKGSEVSLLGQSFLSRMGHIEMQRRPDDHSLDLAVTPRPAMAAKAMNEVRQQPYLAFAVALLAIGALSAMDAVMKGLAQGLGAFSTMCWRSIAATLLVAPVYFATRKRWPTKRAMRLHVLRGTLMIPMSFLFFWGLARVPMAQAIALTFVAPLIALVLAAIFLDEPVGKRMAAGSLLPSRV